MKKEMQIPEGKKIINTKELKNLGFTYYKINKSVAAGTLKRLNKSHYENCDFHRDID